jgi:predicted regulator of Ras-like GTPase activity (Roadblock/LC7/MglB family)
MSINAAARKARQTVDADLGINAVVLASVDGFALVSAMRSSQDVDRIAALASSIASIGSVATQEAGLGRCISLTLHTDAGFAVVRHMVVEEVELVLIMVADGSSLLAQVMYQANQFAKELVVS